MVILHIICDTAKLRGNPKAQDTKVISERNYLPRITTLGIVKSLEMLQWTIRSENLSCMPKNNKLCKAYNMINVQRLNGSEERCNLPSFLKI